MYEALFAYLEQTGDKVTEYLRQDSIINILKPKDIYSGVTDYVFRPAKRLRPAVLLMAYGCVNDSGKEEIALPAAAGVELFHTWTLVHDDIIDNDMKRRGGPSVHYAIAGSSRKTLGISAAHAKKYGEDIAILSGDIQQAWSVKLFSELAKNKAIDPYVALNIISYLETDVITNLLYGETLDVQYSLIYNDNNSIENIGEDNIIEMLWLKTGILYSFAAMAGALIGKNTVDINDRQVIALKEFAGNCGIAFQLQDDILGITGDEEKLGKPIGSDIREGKKTTIVLEAMRNAGPEQREFLSGILGNTNAGVKDIDKTKKLLQELNGVGYTKDLARSYIEKAIPYLEKIENSRYKDLLLMWADYMVNRRM